MLVALMFCLFPIFLIWLVYCNSKQEQFAKNFDKFISEENVILEVKHLLGTQTGIIATGKRYYDIYLTPKAIIISFKPNEYERKYFRQQYVIITSEKIETNFELTRINLKSSNDLSFSFKKRNRLISGMEIKISGLTQEQKSLIDNTLNTKEPIKNLQITYKKGPAI